jgi:adenine-specific DNA-methyltransferase
VGREGEDLSRHDKWLCMMYPRLVLMKKLLSEDGAIFISIGDAEDAQLRKICDEIFGVTCFVANIAWQRTYSQRNDVDGMGVEIEHIYVYGKNPDWTPLKLERTDEMDSKYANPDKDPNGKWQNTSANAPNAFTHQGMVYAIQNPFTGELLYPPIGRCWTFQQRDMLNYLQGWCNYELRDINDAEKRAEVCGTSKELVRVGVKAIMIKDSFEISQSKAMEVYNRGQWPKLFFTKGGQGGLRRKTYLQKVEGRVATNYWKMEEVGHTDEAKKEIKTIFEGKCPFETPKPTRLLKRIIDIATEEDSIILDCFAGSGTTGHAVLMENQQKPESQRKFILIDIMQTTLLPSVCAAPFQAIPSRARKKRKFTARN